MTNLATVVRFLKTISRQCQLEKKGTPPCDKLDCNDQHVDVEYAFDVCLADVALC